MVHPAALAISFGVVLGGAIFALFFYQNTRNQDNRWRYEESPRRDPLEFMQHQFESDICSICLDRFDDDDVFLECCHRFHQRCIEESLRHSHLCPNCRQPAKIRMS